MSDLRDELKETVDEAEWDWLMPYVRETLSYLEREYGDNALSALQSIARRQYQQNILERVGALQDKVRGKVAVAEEG